MQYFCHTLPLVAVWLTRWSMINEVALRRVRLVPGSVTVLERVNHLGAEPAT